jgi:hypothetical protein
MLCIILSACIHVTVVIDSVNDYAFILFSQWNFATDHPEHWYHLFRINARQTRTDNS